jgi:hypothetical protein
MRSHLPSGIRGAVFGTPVSAPNAISPGQNPSPPGIWGQIPPAWRLGLSGVSTSAFCVGQARWLQDYLKNHRRCARPIRPPARTGAEWLRQRSQDMLEDVGMKKPRLPTRVLDIGSVELEAVKLYEIRNERAVYACLSHCWGKTPSFKTETSTLANRKAGMAWASLPKTFQDAIEFTRLLGIRYI